MSTATSFKAAACTLGLVISLAACGAGVSDYTSGLGEGYFLNRVSPLDIYIQRKGILPFEGLIVDYRKRNDLVYGVYVPGKKMNCASPQGEYLVMLYEDRAAFFVLNVKSGDLKLFDDATDLDTWLTIVASGEASITLKLGQVPIYREHIKSAGRGIDQSTSRVGCIAAALKRRSS